MFKFASAYPSAGEHVAGIEDLLRQILLRLPAKSLIRFKLVSMQWLSLITDSEFAQSHVLRNPSSPPPSGMFVDICKPYKIDFFRLGDDDNNTDKQSKPSFDHGVCILKSCNGLYLCRSFDYSHLCVCNPTTNQYRILPPIEGLSMRLEGVPCLVFAFDPSISPHYYVTCEHYTHMWTRVEVYSSKDHKWRLLHESNEIVTNELFDFYDHVYFDANGIIWLGHQSLCFDLNTDTLVQRQRPSWTSIRSMLGSPRFMGGMMDKYVYQRASRGGKLIVYGTSRDYRESLVKYSLCVSRLASVYPEIVTTKTLNGAKFAVRALGVVKGLREEDTVLILAIPDKIISYNFVKETVKTVYNFPAQPAETRDIGAFPFIETLSPV